MSVRAPCRGLTLSIPNLITLARILSVPVIVWAITSGEMMMAFILFLAAGISDAVDGYLAKRFNMASELGAYLDPLADKALIVSIYVSLGIAGAIPRWLVIFVVSRDIMIVGAVILTWLIGRADGGEAAAGVEAQYRRPDRVRLPRARLARLRIRRRLAAARLDDLVAVLTLLSIAFYLAEWIRHVGSADGERVGRNGENLADPQIGQRSCRSAASSFSGSCALVDFRRAVVAAERRAVAVRRRMVLAYLLDPLVRAAADRRSIAPSPPIIIMLVAIALIALAVDPDRAAARRAIAAFIEKMPRYFEQGSTDRRRSRARPGSASLSATNCRKRRSSSAGIAGQAAGMARGLARFALAGGRALISVISLIVITPVVAFYLLLDWERMVAKIDEWMPRAASRHRARACCAKWTP